MAGFRLALAQLNPTVGAVAANARLIAAARAEAAAAGADLVLTPELALSGYPPEDLVLKPAFLAACRAAVEALAAATLDGGPALIVGTPWGENGRIYNAAAVLDGGKILRIVYKHHLPNYRVFDEMRVFHAGPLPDPVEVRGIRLGLMICEDMWFPDVAAHLAANGAQILLVPNGSPYERAKQAERLYQARARQAPAALPLVYLNQVGGQDELIFDGASFVLNGDGTMAARLPAFASQLALTAWTMGADGQLRLGSGPGLAAELDDLALDWQALVVGLGDYVRKNGFPGVVLGFSGGVDSALAAALAVDALGPAAVHAVMLPSLYTSQESLDDADDCARRLGIRLDTLGIQPAMDAFTAMLAPHFVGRASDLTEENLQSRIRGVSLMALSNKLGAMVLSTSNKSEAAVGYATLYGDMCGGYAVLKDVYKTRVYALCDWRNRQHEPWMKGPAGAVIPDRILTKAPTAELRPGQTDQDSLPPYDLLDQILEGLIEEERSVDELVEQGLPRCEVVRVWKMLDRAEYKRRQAASGAKITRRAFGRERRYPITNGFWGSSNASP